VRIPAGSFMMGAVEQDRDAGLHETTMPGVRARRWSGNWPPHPEADVFASVEL
jgi:hypothetical protein